MERRFVIDLCCGLGGWAPPFLARGFQVIGFDIEPFPTYPGDMVQQDIATLDGRRFRGATVIVASPPCQEFSRHDLPWTRARNPPPPDLGIQLVNHCHRIAAEAGVPLVLENVRGAARWIGHPVARHGRQYLWGDGVPALIPKKPNQPDKSLVWGSDKKKAAVRSLIPFGLADYIAWVYSGQEE